MKRADKPFARYLPVSSAAEAWGVVVRAGGCIVNVPGEQYPPKGHPADHAFTWEHGRVLGGWQVVVITQGEGVFDEQRVMAGDVIFVTPGRWHRYRPSAKTGWMELWVELSGDLMARLTGKGRLSAECRVLRPLKHVVLADAMRALHREIREGGGDRPAELAALATRVLGVLTERSKAGGTRLAQAVEKAERLLPERLRRPPSMPALARELGVSYASFRREFARKAGMAPRQYLMRLRLQQAQRLIGTTPLKLEAIAEELGFSSAFHLSAAFKAHFGVSPAKWRGGDLYR